MDAYDVIIIGTGAGGGTLARHLAPSGKRILLLERGDWLPREPANWLAQDVFVDNRYVSPDTWWDEHGTPFQPQVHYFVGGATKLYGTFRWANTRFFLLNTFPVWDNGEERQCACHGEKNLRGRLRLSRC